MDTCTRAALEKMYGRFRKIMKHCLPVSMIASMGVVFQIRYLRYDEGLCRNISQVPARWGWIRQPPGNGRELSLHPIWKKMA